MISLCFLIVGIALGYIERSGRERIKKLLEDLPKDETPVTGATDGSYGQVNEYAANQDKPVGISEPKTPQQLAWEEQQRLQEQNLRVGVTK